MTFLYAMILLCGFTGSQSTQLKSDATLKPLKFLLTVDPTGHGRNSVRSRPHIKKSSQPPPAWTGFVHHVQNHLSGDGRKGLAQRTVDKAKKLTVKELDGLKQGDDIPTSGLFGLSPGANRSEGALDSNLYGSIPTDVQLESDTAAEVQLAFDTAIETLRRHTQITDGPIQFDPQLVAAFLNDTGLAECAPLLSTLPRNLVSGAKGTSVDSFDMRVFMAEVARHIANNPILVTALREVSVPDMFRSPDDDMELYRLVHHCLMVDLVTSACLRDPVIAQSVASEAKKKLCTTQHRAAPFESVKARSIEHSLHLFDKYRLGSEEIYPCFGKVGLPFNVLEAVVEDVCSGRLSNAMAGLALVLAPPGHSPASVSGSHRMVKIHMPFPQEWQHLYISWNLAFTSNWADAPYFASALLAPSVAGAPPDEFILSRAYSLYIQIVAHLCRRGMEHEPCKVPVQGGRDWRHEETTKLWGDINRNAAELYRCGHMADVSVDASIATRGNRNTADSFLARLLGSTRVKARSRLAQAQLRKVLIEFN